MIIKLKDTLKLLGIVIMSACAAVPCTLFLNSNKDMTRIKHLITQPELMGLYNATISAGKVTIAITGGALGLTTTVLLFFYIKHYIDTNRSKLGILKALGYSNFTIAKSFWVFGLSIFVGTSIGYGIAFAMIPAFYSQLRSGSALPDTPLHFNPEVLLYLVILPTLMFSILSIGYSYFKLKRPALELIRGKGSASSRKVKRERSDSSNKPFLRDLKQSTLRSRPSLVFFIGFASFCYADMVQMASGFDGLANDMMAALVLIIGITLALTTMFIATSSVINANGKTIAMLKVFGYTDSECAYAILKGYRPSACVGFIVGTIYQFGLMTMMINLFLTNEAAEKIDYSFNIGAFFIALISFAIIYESFIRFYGAKIRKTSLKEVMTEE